MSYRRNPERGLRNPGKHQGKGKIHVDFDVVPNDKGRRDKVRIEGSNLPETSDPKNIQAILEILKNPEGLKPRRRR